MTNLYKCKGHNFHVDISKGETVIKKTQGKIYMHSLTVCAQMARPVFF